MKAKFVVVAVVVASGHAMADVVSLQASRDNTLYEDSGGALSNGMGEYMFSGLTLQEQRRRAVVAFELIGVPAGSTVTGASLRLMMDRTVSGDMLHRVHRVTASWGEGTSDADGAEGRGTDSAPGDATWIHRHFPTSPWSTPGGSFVAGASASILVGDVGSYSWTGPGLVADVQAWLANPNSNHGWVVIGNEAEMGSAKRFATRESPILAGRPVLTVTFTPPAASCDPDVNCDFALDGFDVETQERAVGGDLTDFCQPDPDYNGDFALDGFDVEAVEIGVGGGPCP